MQRELISLARRRPCLSAGAKSFIICRPPSVPCVRFGEPKVSESPVPRNTCPAAQTFSTERRTNDEDSYQWSSIQVTLPAPISARITPYGAWIWFPGPSYAARGWPLLRKTGENSVKSEGSTFMDHVDHGHVRPHIPVLRAGQVVFLGQLNGG